MIFNAAALQQLELIVSGAAIGEALGDLAVGTPHHERAERFTPEALAVLSQGNLLKSVTAELLRATIDGLNEAAKVGSPTNYEIRVNIHQAYREWVRSSSLAASFKQFHMVRAISSGELGAFSSDERGSIDGMLRTAPIGIAFSSDPGRAFQLAVETCALTDSDIDSCLGAGVVSMLIALLAGGETLLQASHSVAHFIRYLDFHGDVSDALRSATRPENETFQRRANVSELLRSALHATCNTREDLSAVTSILRADCDPSTACLAGQLAAASVSSGVIGFEAGGEW